MAEDIAALVEALTEFAAAERVRTRRAETYETKLAEKAAAALQHQAREIKRLRSQLGGLLEIGVRLLENDRGAWLLLNDRAEAAERQLAESTAREAALREALRVIATQSLCEEDEHSDALKDIIDAAREVALQALAAMEEKQE